MRFRESNTGGTAGQRRDRGGAGEGNRDQEEESDTIAAGRVAQVPDEHRRQRLRDAVRREHDAEQTPEHGDAEELRRDERNDQVLAAKTEAEGILRQRMLQASTPPGSISNSMATGSTSTVTFKEHADKWAELVLPKYKFSTGTVHACILQKHLVPRFGTMNIADVSTLEIQKYVSEMQRRGSAPNSIDQHHQVLSDVMRAAVKWYGLPGNPARGVEMPRMKPVRPRWALTVQQDSRLPGMRARP